MAHRDVRFFCTIQIHLLTYSRFPGYHMMLVIHWSPV